MSFPCAWCAKVITTSFINVGGAYIHVSCLDDVMENAEEFIARRRLHREDQRNQQPQTRDIQTAIQ